MSEDRRDDDRTHLDEDATRAVGENAGETGANGADDELKLPGYRVIQKLGSGGMGQVFLAQQYEPVERQVAIKLIQKRIRSATSEVRFLVERQAMAQMNHPAIAQIFEAGTNPDGYPYFAMEYVPGQTLTEFCTRHRLGLRERLELFVRICQGVSHAHQKGLVHRDLKPGNILVTRVDDEPRPKIIDFGIAVTESSASERRHQGTAGTPHYMSPELFDENIGIDMRADVYSLGVILCELITDCRPYPSRLFEKTDTRIIREQLAKLYPPPAPSQLLESDAADIARAAERRGTTPRRLVHQLTGDLDAITLKAIAHDREQRYASVPELADDIRRYLDRQPVRAVDGGRGYFARRFVQRNALTVTAATLVAVSLAAGLTLAIRGMTEAREQQQIAEARSAELERMVDFQQSMLGDLQPRELGQSFVKRLREQHAQSFAHNADEETIEAGIEAFELAVGQINPTDLAQDLLDEFMMQRAIDNIKTDFADEPRLQAELFETVRDIYFNAGMVDNALPLAERVVELRLEALGPAATGTLEARRQYYRMLSRQADYEAARVQLDAILDNLDPDDPDQVGVRHAAWDSLANHLVRTGENERALEIAQENIERAEEELGPHHADTVRAINTLGYVHALSGRIEQSLPHFRTAVERARGHFEPYEDSYYSAQLNVGAALSYLGRSEEALEVQREVYDILAGHYGRRHDSTLKVMNNIAVTLMDLDRFDEATAMMRDILRLTREAWGPHSPLTLSSMQNLADLYLRTDRPQQALEQMEPVVVWRERLFGEDHGDVLSARYLAATAALDANQPEKALAHLQPALDIRREQLDPDDPTLLETLRLAADIHRQAGDVQAETAHRQEEVNQLINGDADPGADSLESAIRLVELYKNLGEPERIEPLAQDIEGWLEDGGPKLDELRKRFGRVTVTESAPE
ncbi:MULTISPECIES: serine/threonine-protein kinase [unclassified Wenzhouxiangella]|uniref:serine/threonine-protein kinase n=1 Tax=unclassified Wenzhouxiangella TaxID=2613841 RepID=UPI000E3257F8|nr:MULTISPECIES: serine/threonine-protein kinase [unclassified Wenzhouxiangella]RFF28833.1 serine/threonine protein kinase [Wenzhouxiangella sp. 15181]RFP68190.1 serine/threonine protein kinase [Wenzhouxiangella sp. 15190]